MPKMFVKVISWQQRKREPHKRSTHYSANNRTGCCKKKHADTATALHAKYLIIKHGSKLHLGKYMQDTYSIEGCIIQS